MNSGIARLWDEVDEEVRRLTGLSDRVTGGGRDDRALHFVRRGGGMLLQIQRGDAGDDRRRVRIAVAVEGRAVARVARARDADAGREDRQARTVFAVQSLV